MIAELLEFTIYLVLGWICCWITDKTLFRYQKRKYTSGKYAGEDIKGDEDVL